MDQLLFLKEAIRNPGGICAVSPSSAALTRRMVDWIEWETAGSVIEYGPGTGVFTATILERIRQQTEFFAIELSDEFVRLLEYRFPGLTVYHDSVQNVAELAAREGHSTVDAVVSGVPWNDLDDEAQEQCLRATADVLRPGGQFCTFAYLPGFGRDFRQRLERCFSTVEVTSPVWWNLPPAFVYRCRR